MIDFKNLLFSLVILLTSFFSFSLLAQGASTAVPSRNDVIGYKYNLWAVKATSSESGGTYSFTGRIFLDRRKEFKSYFSKDEHSYMFKKEFNNGEIHQISGNQIFTEVIKHSEIQDYYIALKFDQEWVHHTFDDIYKLQNKKLGNEVGCETCNFSKVIYTSKNDWALKLFYEIRPIYKEGINSPLFATEKIQPKNNSSVKESIDYSFEGNDEPLNLTLLSANNMTTYHVVIQDKDSTKENYSELETIAPVYIETFEDNDRTRYLVGNATSYKKVKALAKRIEELGYKNCKIAKCKKGIVKSFLNYD